MSKRNEKGQFKKTNVNKEEVDTQMKNVVHYVWFILKVAVVAIVLMPFLDKVRRHELVGKAIEIVNSTDFGCKSQSCYCPPCSGQPNNTRNPLGSFGGGL